MRDVLITKQPVELYKILKFEGIASSGAEAKMMVADGAVLVNGEVETRKRRQINAGDLLSVDGDELRIVLG
ncbi:RNA-binding S4 domain-containing protein [Simiduia curdlanivorans]|uniref:RNA-binding S4 domain-containing protein n=1 Tax=Simiduia curdlanivorans TaxID=1492769 RepID=A0ABV8V483_9GAMM|nr:RNA-binding S4 domain-containing protein [Simiduia curdlanivorans]MDN3637430.1 RNA-binding S4 domain-containing protein [Simiduia curdlanivorans]